MVQTIDVLVHIGAPSSRQHDERYKAQAKAYPDFAGRVINIVPKSTERVPWHSHYRHDEIVNTDDTTILDNEPTTYLDDTQLAYNALESQLFTSSLDNPLELVRRDASQQSQSLHPCSPRFENSRQSSVTTQRFGGKSSPSNPHSRMHDVAGHPRSRSNTKTSEEEVSQDVSIIQRAATTPARASRTHGLSQSSYLKSPVLDRSSKRRKVNAHRDDESRSDHSTRPQYIPLLENSHLSLAYIGDQPVRSTESASDKEVADAQNSHRSIEATSELPTSYSLSDITSESSRARNRLDHSQRSVSDPGPRTGSGSADVAKPVASTSTKSNKQGVEATTRDKAKEIEPRSGVPGPQDSGERRTDLSSQPNSDLTNPSNTKQRHETAAHPNKNSAASANLSPEPTDLLNANLSTTIHPPSPPTAQNPAESHITPSLAFLTTSLDVEKSYRPVSIAREIRPLERGYWLVDPSPWPLGQQVEFWRFLEQTVGGGRAGWGVWCSRGGYNEDGGREGGGESGPGGGLGIVKVFCWGEVVRHVYLLLYVASKSQVRKLGLQWIDGAGEVIVRMRGGW